MRRARRWLAACAIVVLLAAVDALLIEPRLLLSKEDVRLPVGGERLRIVHLADLHIRDADSLLARRLVHQVAAAKPDLVLMSGDWVEDVRERRGLARRARAAAVVAERLRAVAPVLSVQGHSDYLGEVVAALAGSGVEWLSNEGRRVGRGDGALVLGLNQQVGHEAGERVPAYQPLRIGDSWALGRRQQEEGNANRYLSWDPAPRSLGDLGGPLSWRGGEASVAVWTDGGMAAGVAVHSRYVVGEDRFLRLGGGGARGGRGASFRLVIDGSAPTAGEGDTGVEPHAAGWYRLRLRAEVTARQVRVLGKAWREGTAEPGRWQAELTDDSPTRVEAGTLALWTQGRGAAAFRDLRVQAVDGRVLLEAPLDGPRRLPGWRDGTRATRLALALARSPAVAPGTPRIVLAHSPDVAPEAAAAGIDLVLAGHTHGGQVRLPGFGALLTRTRLGRRYDRGLFTLETGAGGTTALYVNPGVGTSFLPIRFFDPPGWAQVELGGDRRR